MASSINPRISLRDECDGIEWAGRKSQADADLPNEFTALCKLSLCGFVNTRNVSYHNSRYVTSSDAPKSPTIPLFSYLLISGEISMFSSTVVRSFH